MDGITEIRASKQEAQKEYEAYKDALEKRPQVLHAEIEQAYRDLAGAYGHMRHGRAIIDVRQAIRDTGFDDEGWPHLAIVRADFRQCTCGQNRNGKLFFSGRRSLVSGQYRQPYPRPEDVVFSEMKDYPNVRGYTEARTSAPLIPPSLLPEDGVENYYLLWEAEEWTVSRIPRIPRDPMLLSRVNDTIFGVLATWEMTDLERTVIAGRIA